MMAIAHMTLLSSELKRSEELDKLDIIEMESISVGPAINNLW